MPKYKLTGTSPMNVFRPFIYEGRVSIAIGHLLGGIRATTGRRLESRLTLHSTQFRLDQCFTSGDLVAIPRGWQCMVIGDVSLETLRTIGANGIGPGRGTFDVEEVV